MVAYESVTSKMLEKAIIAPIPKAGKDLSAPENYWLIASISKLDEVMKAPFSNYLDKIDFEK